MGPRIQMCPVHAEDGTGIKYYLGQLEDISDAEARALRVRLAAHGWTPPDLAEQRVEANSAIRECTRARVFA